MLVDMQKLQIAIGTKKAIIDEIKNLYNLNTNVVPFIKNPKDQEASIAAIFYELIGKGKIEKSCSNNFWLSK